MTDREQLARYVRSGDAEAFRAVVAAHVDLVYSCARRGVGGDRQLAEDVTQVVFAVLARKAGALPAGTVLAGWLVRTTRHAAAHALRGKRRREKHERRAAVMAEHEQQQRARGTSEAGWAALEPHLEDAIARLRGPERDAVVLRYYKAMSLRQVAEALSIGEDAAAKRVSRALERMRRFFAGRGLSVSVGVLGAAVVGNAVEAAPAGLAEVAATSGVAGSAVAVSGEVAEVLRALSWAKARVAVTGSVAATFVAALAAWLMMLSTAQVAATRASAAAAATAPASGPVMTGAGIAPGWPVALPGEIAGTPALADLDGDGVPEIVVPTIGRGGIDGGPVGRRLAHPAPRVERLVHAYRLDGTPLAGWPAVVMDGATRRRERAELGGVADFWSTSPAVMDWRGVGRDQIAITNRIGVVTIEQTKAGAPLVRQVAGQGDAWATVPLADVDGDGRVDVVMGWVLSSIDGADEVAGWPRERILRGGFAPAIADVLGDGEPLLYHPFYADTASVCGFDRFGRVLPGWPQAIVGHCREGPSLGDVDGDGRLDVVADNGGTIYAWTWDGQPLAGTRRVGRTNGVFKQGLILPTSPTLADLDGDGRAEVIVVDARDNSIKAWRGDGTGLTSADGTLVRLAGPRIGGGVSVADLGGDGVMDLFAGTWWVRLHKDGRTEAVCMLPEPAASDTFCTIADVDGDGRAEVVFGTRDGRVYVYRTGLAYRPEWVLWQTRCGNMRRTGAARAPAFKAAGPDAKAPPPNLPDGIVVNVIDAATKEPLGGARLTLDTRDGVVPARCDAQGAFAVPLRAQRWLSVLAEAPGHAAVRATLEGWSPGGDTLTIALPGAVTIGGVVRDAEGNAVAGARVTVVARGSLDGVARVDVRHEVVTDGRGRWRSDRVPARYEGLWVRVEHPDYGIEDARLGRTERSAAALRDETSTLVLRPVVTEVAR